MSCPGAATHGPCQPYGTSTVSPSCTSSRISIERPGEEEVRDGDTVLVPYGWHGPAVAAPGHDMYYLNVMAGPGSEREWKITDHPEQAWVRASWTDQGFDPRLVEEES